MGGKAYDYPTSVQAGNKSTVIVGVVNHEYMLVNYTMRILLNNTSIDDTSTNSTSITNNTSYNSTLLNNTPIQHATMNHSSMENVSLQDNSRVIYSILSMNLTLQNNETWERPVTYILNNTGDRQKLEFLLYKEGNFTESYRDLHLWVNVTKTDSYFPGNATNLTVARGSERNSI